MTPPPTYLDDISTRWAVVGDPLQFVLRYAPAVRGYIAALLPDTHAADDVCQDFLEQVLRKGFMTAAPDRGRFRHYLKAAIRNAVRMHFRKQSRLPATLADELDVGDEPQDPWAAAWRQCILDRAWESLHRQQRQGGPPFFHVLRAAVDHPDDDSRTQAARLTTTTGRPITAEAFRQQLHRARKLFAEALIAEVAATVQARQPDAIAEELADLQLLEFVRDHISPTG
ncbi:MAG: sigma-70 family RNA polymerase sigma factor [Gemmataceae bacterium]|nr:sigma-70 family RNA polymerase sigma factor [Gemmataceae bacterium]